MIPVFFYGQQKIQTRYAIINEAYHKRTVHNHNDHLSSSATVILMRELYMRSVCLYGVVIH